MWISDVIMVNGASGGLKCCRPSFFLTSSNESKTKSALAISNRKSVFNDQMGTQLAGFHVPKQRFFLPFLFKQFFFFADSSRKKGFQPVKSPYFCVGQQKKKRTAILDHVNRLIAGVHVPK